jgi:hypothetical protein
MSYPAFGSLDAVAVKLDKISGIRQIVSTNQEHMMKNRILWSAPQLYRMDVAGNTRNGDVVGGDDLGIFNS